MLAGAHLLITTLFTCSIYGYVHVFHASGIFCVSVRKLLIVEGKDRRMMESIWMPSVLLTDCLLKA